MTTFTTDFQIRPEDGWTLVATNPAQLEIKPAVYHPWWVAIVDSGVPAVTLIGFPMGRDPSNRNETFFLPNGVTGLVYVRIATPTDSNTVEKMFFNVTTAPGTTSAVGAVTVTGNVAVIPSTTNSLTGTTSTTGATSTQVIAAVAANRIYASALSLYNTSATPVTVNFQDGSGGTTLWTAIVPAQSGYNMNGGVVPLFKTTSGNGLFFQSSAGVTTLGVNVAGFSGT